MIATTPIFYDSHMHTPLCKHATGEPEEYAAVAEARGLKGIIITCHNPGPVGWSSRVRMEMSQFNQYLAMVERAREAWNGRVDVRLGLESDYIPGMEKMLEDLHSRADFNHILGSVHPMLPYYKEKYYEGDILAFQKQYFHHVAMAAETGLFDTISHPDLVKTTFSRHWNLEPLKESVKNALDRIAQTGVAMELNTSGLYKAIKEMNPGRFILEEMQIRSIPIVVGSDAHQPERVADKFNDALTILMDVGYTDVSIYLNRKRHKIDIMQAQASLSKGLLTPVCA